jgi:hypothetical protein
MEEEQQIQDFVHALLGDPALLDRVRANPAAELERLGYTPRVARLIKENLDVLTGDAPFPPPFMPGIHAASFRDGLIKASWWW